MRLRLGIVLSLSFLCVTSLATAGDWPMWRHDAARSGSTPDKLATDLHLQWTRELPAPQPAWPASQFKLQFDAAYQPVVADGRMFVGSTANDTVTAYATQSGDELWRFYTDGPVRFAPVVWNDRAYAVSDDGRLYCLNATSGELVWKYNGAPQRRPIIGNGRLISTWPARGGVVVDDGVAYFASGLWPSMGVFVHAVDATSGERIWINGNTSSLFVTHPHGADSFGSISPQGALAVSGDNLIVPGGRTLPGVFDRLTGTLKHFTFGGKGSGGHQVFVAGPSHIVGNQIMRTDDGAEMGRIFGSLVADGQIIGTEAGGDAIVVTSVAGQYQDVEVKDRRGNKSVRAVFTPKSTKRVTPSVPGKVFLSAGPLLYAANKGQVVAYDLPRALNKDGTVEPVWSATVSGNVAAMLAANDRLFVVTDDARIHCFGAEPASPVLHPLQPAALTASADGARIDQVQELLTLAPLSGGYAVSLDASDPELLMELVRQSDFRVVAVDTQGDRLDALRQSADAVGVYGPRISAHNGDAVSFHFPPYVADLVLRESEGPLSASELKAVFTTLRPYGGAACLRSTKGQHEAIASAVNQAGLENAELQRVGEWTVLRRVGALPGSADWTHHYGDASNSVVSREERVKAPLGVLWFGGPSNDKVLPRHGHGPSPEIAGGRLFIEGPDMLRCVDVYTGRVWWERDLPGLGAYYNITSHHPGAGEIGSNYVSLADHVYVIYGTDLLELEARTGKTTRQFAFPGDGRAGETRPNWGGLAVSGDVLVATAAPSKIRGMESSKEANVPPGSKALVKPHAEWRLLKGEDPAADWTSSDFDDSQWAAGEAGFGFADGDDRTVLDDMRGKYQRAYIRATFDGRAAADADKLTLMINFDDAFIAYLNGKEVLRRNVGEGNGAAAAQIGSHEAEGYEPLEIKDFRKLLKRGNNVLAIEGHNAGVTSSDFSLDPYLIATLPQDGSKVAGIAEQIEPTRYSSSSRELVVFDRHTGSVLWNRPAEFGFRHNAVCLSGDTVFAIDGMSPQALALLRRRGVTISSEPKLLALDLRSGNVKWSTEENVFGTFLNYSAEHDVLVQGGSAFRDRAKDEVTQGLIAYRGHDGEVLWQRPELQYGGPCLLWKDRLITNGNGGFELDLLTGETTGWDYKRMYGCNTAIGCQSLLTFRSGAAGFYDLENDSGTGNFGGFKSSCTSNLVPADGVLNAPDYTRTCLCAYQLQTSLAFVHMEEADSWTFNPAESMRLPLKSVGLNLGAPGDRRDADGILWLDYPVIGGPSPELTVSTEPAEPDWFLRHSSLIAAESATWIAASGAKDLRSLKWNVTGLATPGTYRVRLVFAKPAEGTSGGGHLAVTLQGEVSVDINDSDDADGGVIVKDIPGVVVGDTLHVTLTPAAGGSDGGPKLCGVALIAE